MREQCTETNPVEHLADPSLAGSVIGGIAYGVEAVRQAPPESRGLAMGAYTAFLDLALGVASPLLGLVAGGAGIRAVFLFSALTVLCVPVATLCLLLPPSAPAEQATTQPAAGAPRTTPAGGPKEMRITRAGTQPSLKGPADWFTGTARIDPLFQANDPARAAGAQVTFEPCSRTAWHTHPLGQVLIVTSGVGRVQQWGGPVEEIRPGDVVWTPPGVKHWHGASPTTAMTHIAIQEALDGKVVEWMEKVTDTQYGR